VAVKDLFRQELKVVNIGLRAFAEDLEKQDKRVVHVDWKPAAGGDERLQSILERMRKKT
jgi:FdrA protein